jgi:hypothetical protein
MYLIRHGRNGAEERHGVDMRTYHRVHVQLGKKDRQQIVGRLNKGRESGRESARVLRRASILRQLDQGQTAAPCSPGSARASEESPRSTTFGGKPGPGTAGSTASGSPSTGGLRPQRHARSLATKETRLRGQRPSASARLPLLPQSANFANPAKSLLLREYGHPSCRLRRSRARRVLRQSR